MFLLCDFGVEQQLDRQTDQEKHPAAKGSQGTGGRGERIFLRGCGRLRARRA